MGCPFGAVGEPKFDRFGLRAGNALDEAQQCFGTGDVGESLLAILRQHFQPVTICNRLTSFLAKTDFQNLPVVSSELKAGLLGEDLDDVHDREKPSLSRLVVDAADPVSLKNG